MKSLLLLFFLSFAYNTFSHNTLSHNTLHNTHTLSHSIKLQSDEKCCGTCCHHKVDVSKDYWTEEKMRKAVSKSSKSNYFVENPSLYPYKAIGRLFYTDNGEDYSCTGAVTGPSLVVTAGMF